MSEQEFTNQLLEKLNFTKDGFSIGSKINVLYALTVEENGIVNMGVDADSGEVIRGRGKGFEQDILVYQKVEDAHTSIIPRVIIEVKYAKVTSHDAIIYSEKAKRIRTIYPYVRYGFLLGGVKNISPRIIRLGSEFNFIIALDYPFEDESVNELKELLFTELGASLSISKILSGTTKIYSYRNNLDMRLINR